MRDNVSSTLILVSINNKVVIVFDIWKFSNLTYHIFKATHNYDLTIMRRAHLLDAMCNQNETYITLL